MKVADKLPVRLRDDSDFKKEFSDIVWSDVDEPAVFEEKWRDMIIKYDLVENRWFFDIFEDRSCWIPAFFRDISMSGLFRTTSLSESENNYFKRFLNKNSDLVCLYMNYCSAIDAQRHTYQKTTLADETGVPLLISKLSIEFHAASVYTNHIFKEVQSEIEYAIVSYLMSKMESASDVKLFVVDDNVDGVFIVCHNLGADYLSCTCKLFTRKGYLCRHIFYVLRNLKVPKIPKKYIVQRWCKLSRLSSQDAQLQVVEPVSQNSPIGNNAFFKVASDCIGYVNGNDEAR